MKTHNGFTLIELMVVVAVIAILVTQGMPAFQEALTNSRLTTGAQALQTTAQWARNEAIKRNETIRLSSDGSALTVTRDLAAVTPEVMRAVPLVAPAVTPAFSVDYASNGLTLPLGTEQTVSTAVGVKGCGESLRCPSVLLGAGGLVRICPMGDCK